MPRVEGIYSVPVASRADATSLTTVSSAPYKALLDDLEADANLARPVTAGGTGSSTPAGARANLGLGALATLDAVSAPQIADGSVTNSKIAEWAVINSKIADGAVTTTKISPAALETSAEVPFTFDDSRLMTSAAIRTLIRTEAIGATQTYQDVTGSRVGNTSYQNPTQYPIMVNMRISGTSELVVQVSPNNWDWVSVGNSGNTIGDRKNVCFIVPPWHFYRVAGTLPGGSYSWSELR